MNFDVIPTAHNEWGFYTAVGLMLFIPVLMLIAFSAGLVLTASFLHKAILF
jgi:Mg2+ and Co2+ transporter CorA